METFMAGLGPGAFAAVLAIALFAGFVKGAVGFAMPLIMVSGFSIFMPQEIALAGLILPTLLTNILQGFRQGPGPAVQTTFTYRRFLVASLICIGISAPFADVIPRQAYLLILGIPITAYAALQLAGRSLAIRLRHRVRAEWLLGVIGGLFGGISGIWGPPLVVLLLSTGTEKVQFIRAQGVVYLLCSVALLVAHLATGLFNQQSLALSAALCVPALIGIFLGFVVQDRLNQQRFVRWTQTLLVISGLNMVRQALFSA